MLPPCRPASHARPYQTRPVAPASPPDWSRPFVPPRLRGGIRAVSSSNRLRLAALCRSEPAEGRAKNLGEPGSRQLPEGHGNSVPRSFVGPETDSG